MYFSAMPSVIQILLLTVPGLPIEAIDSLNLYSGLLFLCLAAKDILFLVSSVNLLHLLAPDGQKPSGQTSA